MAPTQKPLTVGKGTSYTRPVTPGRNPRPVSAKPSQASKVRAAQKTTSSGITRRPDGRPQTEGRKARQATSTAKVTTSGSGTSGSAKVTTGRGMAPTPQAPAQTPAQRGQAAVQAAPGRRAARATSERMGAIVKGAQAARNVAGALKAGIRGGALAAGLQAYNTGAGTLTANAPKIAKQISAMKNKVGPKKVGPGKVGTIAQSFNKSFAAARKAGKSEFTFKGKKYNTKMK